MLCVPINAVKISNSRSETVRANVGEGMTLVMFMSKKVSESYGFVNRGENLFSLVAIAAQGFLKAHISPDVEDDYSLGIHKTGGSLAAGLLQIS